MKTVKGRTMSMVAKSLFVYGIYVFGLGLGTLTLQQYIMPIMGMNAGQDHWVYIVGVFAVALSYYYIFSAKQEDMLFARLSVHGRIWFFCATVGLIVVKIAPIMMLPIAAVDLASALWTLSALKFSAS